MGSTPTGIAKHGERCRANELTLTSAAVENIIGDTLPMSLSRIVNGVQTIRNRIVRICERRLKQMESDVDRP